MNSRDSKTPDLTLFLRIPLHDLQNKLGTGETSSTCYGLTNKIYFERVILIFKITYNLPNNNKDQMLLIINCL